MNFNSDPITVEYLERLPAGVTVDMSGVPIAQTDRPGMVFIPFLRLTRSYTLVQEGFTGLNSMIQRGAGGDAFIDGKSIFSEEVIRAACKHLNLELQANVALMELFTLAHVNAKLTGVAGLLTPTESLGRTAIAERIHELLDANPHLVHPRVLVYSSVTRANVSLMQHLLDCAVEFDVDRTQQLVSRASEHGLGFLKDLGLDADQQESSVISAAAKGPIGLRTLRVLIKTFDDPDTLSKLVLCELGKTGGQVASGRQDYLDVLLDTVKAFSDVVERHRGPDSAALVRWTETTEDLVGLDTAWADAHNRHPVLQMIFEAAIRCPGQFPGRPRSTIGFPGKPLEDIAQGLNSLMVPLCRLPLDALTNNQLLKLITLGAKASHHDALLDHYDSSEFRSDATPLEHSAAVMMEWIVDRTVPGLPPITVDEFQFDAKRYTDILGDQWCSRLAARIAQQSMTHNIRQAVPDAVPGLDPNLVTAAPVAAARRNRAI